MQAKTSRLGGAETKADHSHKAKESHEQKATGTVISVKEHIQRPSRNGWDLGSGVVRVECLDKKS